MRTGRAEIKDTKPSLVVVIAEAIRLMNKNRWLSLWLNRFYPITGSNSKPMPLQMRRLDCGWFPAFEARVIRP
ncbi:MAG: hypothetical protein CV081_06250 [Nitrospira sp. LK265]|nr:hypothetical protein [Nitrospira sp. LK265]